MRLPRWYILRNKTTQEYATRRCNYECTYMFFALFCPASATLPEGLEQKYKVTILSSIAYTAFFFQSVYKRMTRITFDARLYPKSKVCTSGYKFIEIQVH